MNFLAACGKTLYEYMSLTNQINVSNGNNLIQSNNNIIPLLNNFAYFNQGLLPAPNNPPSILDNNNPTVSSNRDNVLPTENRAVPSRNNAPSSRNNTPSSRNNTPSSRNNTPSSNRNNTSSNRNNTSSNRNNTSSNRNNTTTSNRNNTPSSIRNNTTPSNTNNTTSSNKNNITSSNRIDTSSNRNNIVPLNNNNNGLSSRNNNGPSKNITSKTAQVGQICASSPFNGNDTNIFDSNNASNINNKFNKNNIPLTNETFVNTIGKSDLIKPLIKLDTGVRRNSNGIIIKTDIRNLDKIPSVQLPTNIKQENMGNFWGKSEAVEPKHPIMPLPSIQTKIKRQQIPKKIRLMTWKAYHGDAEVGCCYACGKTIDILNWHCSHVISDKRGGEANLSNLRTCCPHCNLSCGEQNLYVFIQDKRLNGLGSKNMNTYFKKYPDQKNSKR